MNLHPVKNQEFRIEKKNPLLKIFKLFSLREKAEIVSVDESDENRELLESIVSAQKDWDIANMNFEYADNLEMIDYYTYKIKACQVRYEYLIKKAKEKGIRVDLLGSEMYDTSRLMN